MATWRRPGQPYEVVIDGIGFTCKPMTRADSMALASKSAEITDGADMEDIYKVLIEQIDKIDYYPPGNGVPGVSIEEAMEYQTHDFMLALFQQIIGASGMTDEESKNSKPSSAGPQPAGSAEPTVGPENVST